MDLTVTGNHTKPNTSTGSTIEIADPEWTELRGQKIYQTQPLYRDIATFMEHPESYQFYQKYLSNPERMNKMMTCLKLYDNVSNYLDNDNLNAYHKIFVMYNLLKYTKLHTLHTKPEPIRPAITEE
jgi:hypothetical protein